MSRPATSSTTGSCSSASSAPTAALEQRIAAAAAHAGAPAVAAAQAAPPGEEAVADFDPEVAAIFTDEATELIDASEQALSSWRSEPGNADYRLSLKRPLHTLKGGARMAGIMAMGDLSHELESLVMSVETGRLTADEPMFAAIQSSLDELARMREHVAKGQRVAPARALIARLQALSRPGGAAAAAAEPAAAAPPPPPAPVSVSAPPPPAAELELVYEAEAPAPSPEPQDEEIVLSPDEEIVDTGLARLNAELVRARSEAIAGEPAAEPAAPAESRARGRRGELARADLRRAVAVREAAPAGAGGRGARAARAGAARARAGRRPASAWKWRASMPSSSTSCSTSRARPASRAPASSSSSARSTSTSASCRAR